MGCNLASDDLIPHRSAVLVQDDTHPRRWAAGTIRKLWIADGPVTLHIPTTAQGSSSSGRANTNTAVPAIGHTISGCRGRATLAIQPCASRPVMIAMYCRPPTP